MFIASAPEEIRFIEIPSILLHFFKGSPIHEVYYFRQIVLQKITEIFWTENLRFRSVNSYWPIKLLLVGRGKQSHWILFAFLVCPLLCSHLFRDFSIQKHIFNLLLFGGLEDQKRHKMFPSFIESFVTSGFTSDVTSDCARYLYSKKCCDKTWTLRYSVL